MHPKSAAAITARVHRDVTCTCTTSHFSLHFFFSLFFVSSIILLSTSVSNAVVIFFTMEVNRCFC